MNTNREQLTGIWNQVVNSVKQSVISPSVWRALEKTVPIVWDGDTFVVGFNVAAGSIGGQLAAYDTRQAIERAVRDATGNTKTQYRLIEGDALSDWEYVKARDAAAASHQEQVVVRTQKQTAASTTWDDVYDAISRLWQASPMRGQASGRARFLVNALTLTEEAARKFYPGVLSQPDEAQDRGLSRVLERIGSYSATDAAVVGMLLLDRFKE